MPDCLRAQHAKSLKFHREHTFAVFMKGAARSPSESDNIPLQRFTPGSPDPARDRERDALGVPSPDLPLVRSQNATWWYATYHNVTAIVGAGVLGLPTSMVYLGWGGGIAILVASWFITLFTLFQMIQMHEMKDGPGEEVRRIETYYQLGQKAFGPRLGLWIVMPQQIIVQVGVNIVYMLTGGEALWQFYQLILCDHLDPVVIGAGLQCCGRLGRATFIIFFALVQVLLAQLGDFNSIANFSLLASVMAICYCAIAWIDSLHLGKSNHSGVKDTTKPVDICPTAYQFHHNATGFYPHITESERTFGVLSALGVVAFAYAGHNVVLEIQSTLPVPSKGPMWRGVMVAYIIVAICYFPVAFAGFWAFGTDLTSRGASPGDPRSGNILHQLGEPRGVIAAANLFVAIHVAGGYLVFAMPMFELMETVLVRFFNFKRTYPRYTSNMRIVTRTLYVVLTAFIALTFPFFKDLLAFVGGFALTPTTYFLPCIIWLRLRRREDYTDRSWLLNTLLNWLLIVIGLLIAICAAIGGMRDLYVDTHTQWSTSYVHCNDTTAYPTNCTAVQVSFNTSNNFQFLRDFTCKGSVDFTSPSTQCKVYFV